MAGDAQLRAARRGLDEARATRQELDLVLAEEIGDAVVARFHRLVLALEHLREVEVEPFHLDAVVGKLVAGLLVVLGGLQQRLRRDAADVGAGAAERRLAVRAAPVVRAGGLQSELCRADGGDVAARPAADDQHIERIHGQISRISRAGSSSASLIATRNSTASRPSMMRWS